MCLLLPISHYFWHLLTTSPSSYLWSSLSRCFLVIPPTFSTTGAKSPYLLLSVVVPCLTPFQIILASSFSFLAPFLTAMNGILPVFNLHLHVGYISKAEQLGCFLKFIFLGPTVKIWFCECGYVYVCVCFHACMHVCMCVPVVSSDSSM